jgi:hypothetical protein
VKRGQSRSDDRVYRPGSSSNRAGTGAPPNRAAVSLAYRSIRWSQAMKDVLLVFCIGMVFVGGGLAHGLESQRWSAMQSAVETSEPHHALEPYALAATTWRNEHVP